MRLLTKFLLSVAVAFTCVTAQAQIAADETLQLTATLPSPWGAPLIPSMPKKTRLQLAPRAFAGPAPLQCEQAEYSFLRTPAEGLFEGNLPAPAQQSARALGLPEHIVTQRIHCPNAGFDVHRSADGRAWIGLDNTVIQWERVSIATTPEATVQSLLIHHFASGFSLSTESIHAQSAWLSPALTQRFQRWLTRTAASDEVPELNGDPFTDSQEAPESFTLAPAKPRGDRAELTVTFQAPESDPYPVVVELVRLEGVWRIDDLRYRDSQRLSLLLAH